MDKDDILDMIREEIRQGFKVVVGPALGNRTCIEVDLVFNGEIISSDHFYLPECEG